MKWRKVDPCPAVNPFTEGMCEQERGHDGDHVHTEWERGEMVDGVWWSTEDAEETT